MNFTKNNRVKWAARFSAFLFMLIAIAPSAAVYAAAQFTQISGKLPDPNDFSQGGGVYMTVATADGTNYNLEASDNEVRIYTKNKTGTITLTEGGMCAGTGDRGNVKTTFRVWGMEAAQTPADTGGSSGYYSSYSSTPFYTGSAQVASEKHSSTASCGAEPIGYVLKDENKIPSGATGSLAPYAGWYGMEFQATNDSGTGWNMYKISLAGSKMSYYDGSGFKFALKDEGGGIPGTPGNFRMGFAPGCTLKDNDTNTVTMDFYDMDAGVANQNYENPISASVFVYDHNGNPVSFNKDGFTNGRRDYNLTGGNGGSDHKPVTVRGTYKYVLEVYHIYSANGIQFQLPFDSFNDAIDCTQANPDWNLSGSSTVSNTTTSGKNAVTFKHSVKNSAGSDPADYKWKVQGEFCNNGSCTNTWTNSDCSGDNKGVQSSYGGCPLNTGDASGVAANGKDPNTANQKYVFPSGSSAGDKYCERIGWTNDTGPDSPSGGVYTYSTPVCVGYKTSGTGGTKSCTQYSHNMSGHAIYKYSVFNTPSVTMTPAYIVDGTGDHRDNHSAAGTKWGSFSTGAVYQSPASSGADITGGGVNSTHATYSPDGSSTYTLIDGGADGGSQAGQYDLNYPAPTSSGFQIYIEKWLHYDSDGNGSLDKWRYTYSMAADGVNPGPDWADFNCYKATCTINFDANVPGTSNGVQAGQDFHVHATITNTGEQPLAAGMFGNYLSITGSGDFPITSPRPNPLAFVFNDDPIDPGDTYNLDDTYGSDGFTARAPSGIGHYNLSAYPDLWGRMRLGPDCGAPAQVDTYQQFDINASASINSTDGENPTSIHYTTSGNNTGTTISANASSSLTRQPSGAINPSTVDGPHNVPHSYGSASDSYCVSDIAPPATPAGCTYLNYVINAGDNYCANLTISPAHGWTGPSGVAPGATDDTATPDCFTVHNEPYVHVFGSDVLAGGGFGDNCSNTPGGIKTYTRGSSANPVGSGVQIGALAIGPINGFSSAIQRGSTPTGSTGLSFSNTSNVGGGSHAPALGGNLGGVHCAPDYFSANTITTGDTTNSINVSDNSTTPVTKYYEPAGGTLTINGGTIGNGANEVIFVKGNVVISSNIAYGSNNWGTIENVPSFMLVATGNIYIKSDSTSWVSQLDGQYIAQPTSASGTGQIYTCANGTNAYDEHDLLFNCRHQLLVNGAFVAQTIFFDRSFGSLRYGYPGEHLGASVQDCGDSGNTILSDCAGEIFNFTPEIYLSQPAITPSSGPTTGKYEYITSLAPVL